MLLQTHFVTTGFGFEELVNLLKSLHYINLTIGVGGNYQAPFNRLNKMEGRFGSAAEVLFTGSEGFSWEWAVWA